MAILSPKQINQGLKGWYDASVTSSLQLSGSNLIGWLDLSGSGANLDTIQGNNPQLSSRTVNNRPAIKFNNDGAVYRSATTIGTTAPQATIAFVCIPDAFLGTVVSSRTTIDNSVGINANGTVNMSFSTTSFNTTTRCKTGEVTRIIASYNGNSSRIWVNGVATDVTGFTEDRIHVCMIGADGAGGTDYFDGLVCEAVIYENALTNNEAFDLDRYFQRKWDGFSNKIRFDTSANGYTSNIISSGTLNSTITVNVPTNVANGDLMLGVVQVSSANNPGTLSPPTGWNELANNFNSDGQFCVHTWVGYRIANTEPTSYQWGIETSNNDDIAQIFRLLGNDKRYYIDSVGTIKSDAVLSANVNAFSTSNNDAMVVYIFGGKNGASGYLKANGTNISPQGTTQLLYLKSRVFSSAVGTAIAYEYKPTASNIGTNKTFAAYDTTSAYASTFAFAIKQAPYSTVSAQRLIETGKVKQYTDNFNRADTAVGDLGPDWDVITGALKITNNQFESVSAGNFSYAKVSETVVDFSDDHSAQIKVTALGTGDLLGPAVRVTANGCYVINLDGFNSGERRISYINGTSITYIGTANIPIVAGDILKLTIQGSVITAYKNGIQVDQVSNTAYTTGQPGIFYNRSNINTTKGDDFVAEDLNSPTSGVMAKMYDDGTIQAGYFSEKEYLDRIKYHYDGDIWAGKFIESE